MGDVCAVFWLEQTRLIRDRHLPCTVRDETGEEMLTHHLWIDADTALVSAALFDAILAEVKEAGNA